MAELSAKSPCEGLLPLTLGGLTVTEEAPGALTSLAPYKGQVAALDQALQAAHGLGFPAPNASVGTDAARVIWFGRDQALMLGPVPDPSLGALAAVTDQSDAWASVRLSGAGVEAALARLVPVDTRAAAFAPGQTMRSQLGHMSASITRVAGDAVLILVFRSMAGTLLHDLKTAMAAVAQRG